MEGNSIKTFENLCKIFEMRIKLDNVKGEKTSPEVSENYEKYAKKIDAFYNEEFQKELKCLISPENTLESEKERLEKLICLLEDRLAKRSHLVGEYYSTTGNYISGLQLIVSETELTNKKERLSLITKYLDTKKEIENIKDAVMQLKNELKEEEIRRDEYLDKNKILEDELYSAFVTCINKDNYYKEIEEEKIIDILSDISSKASEFKETLDITKKSVESLLSSGMDDEYESYIDEANKNYSLWKDREIVLEIYKLVINFEDEFSDLLNKRNSISKLLDERKSIILEKEDLLISLENVIMDQNKILTNEKEVLDNIVNYTSRLDFKTERLKELENVIKEPEIVVILREYNIYDEVNDSENNVETDFINYNSSSEIQDIVVKEHNPYRIISVDDAPDTLNVNLAKLKGSSVREKVNKKLNLETDSFEVIDAYSSKDENPNIESINLHEERLKEDNEITDEPILNVSENHSFWIPVSDSKLDTSEFPNIDIPVSKDNLNIGEDNLGFPEVSS